jgi:putative transposase
VVKSAGRKRLVGYLEQHYGISQRRACRAIPISCKAVRYVNRRPERDAALIARLKALDEQYPRYGYLLLHAMLRAERLVKNRKRTDRVYTQLGLQVRTKRRKKWLFEPALVSRPCRRSANHRCVA